MPLPTLITVQGSYTKPEGSAGAGSPDTGKVIFKSEKRLQAPSLDAQAGPFFYDVTLDSAGSFQIVIPATNDPLWVPSDTTYIVKEALSSVVRLRRIIVPYNQSGGVLNLADAVEVVEDPNLDQYIVRSEHRILAGPWSVDGNAEVKVGKHRWYNHTGRTLTLAWLSVSAGTAPTGTGSALTVDLNKNGVTVFTNQTNRPKLDPGVNVVKATLFDVADIADGQYYTVDIDTIGGTLPGADVVIEAGLKWN